MGDNPRHAKLIGKDFMLADKPDERLVFLEGLDYESGPEGRSINLLHCRVSHCK